MSFPICQVCSQEMGADKRPLMECPSCQTRHHQECWDYAGGCSVFGCDRRSGADLPPVRDLAKVKLRRTAWSWENAGLLLLLLLLAGGLFNAVSSRKGPEISRSRSRPDGSRPGSTGPRPPTVPLFPPGTSPCAGLTPGPIDLLDGEWRGSGMHVTIKGYRGCFLDDDGRRGKFEFRFSHDRKCQGTWNETAGGGRGALAKGILEVELGRGSLVGCWREQDRGDEKPAVRRIKWDRVSSGDTGQDS
ncbi:MAG: hypothetical protein HY303_07330, partial [Candidatus Wallbacteria bacterium]|nr:hypothetical protein [Candidatus Wallbacteria bacterium]